MSIFCTIRDRSYGSVNIIGSGLGSEYLVKRLDIQKKFIGHEGCVNTVAWNKTGNLILSGSDDCQLNIYRMCSDKPSKSISSGHRANIFCAKFLPNTGDTKIVSCSGDGILHYNDINGDSSYGQSPFHCHTGTTYEVNTTPDEPHTFLSSGEDGTIRLFDLRCKTKCCCNGCRDDVLIDCGDKAVTSFSVNPVFPYYIAVGCEDSTLRVYDRRSLTTGSMRTDDVYTGLMYKIRPTTLQQRNCRVTSLNYSSDGRNLLASFCSDYVYLFDSDPHVCDPADHDNTSEEPNGMCSSDAGNDLPVKRLRLRGDWSDTGPDARPESEEPSNEESGFIQRMSGYLTRWIQESIQNNRRNRQHATSESQTDSEDGETAGNPRGDETLSSTAETFDTGVDAPAVTHGSSADVNTRRHSNTSSDSCEDPETSGYPQKPGHAPEDSDGSTDTGDLNELPEMTRDEPEGAATDKQGSVGYVGDNGPTTSDDKTSKGAETGPDLPRDEHSILMDDEGTSVNKTGNVGGEQGLLQDGTRSDGECSEVQNGTTRANEEYTSSLVDNDPVSENNEQWTGSRTYDSDETPASRSVPTESGNRTVGEARRNAAASVIQNYFRHRQRKESAAKNNKVPVYSAIKQVYKGHRNARTMIKEANFWGDDFVLSGSDCGRVFIWSRHTGALVMLLEGDSHVVNCVQPHPFDPVLATSGIDYDVKLWTPTAPQVSEMEHAEEVVSRNEKMLREGRDTLTVPASFMIRFLSSLHRVRVHTLAGDHSTVASDSDDED